MAGARIGSKDVLEEVRRLRTDLQMLTKLLVGAPDEPDKPGLVERVRSLEASDRTVKWLAGLVAVVLVGDIVTRFIGWYRGAP